MRSVTRTLEKTAEDFIASRRSEGTRKSYRADLARWVKFCNEHDVDLCDPTQEQANKFRADLKARYAPASLNRRLASLSSIYKTACAGREPVAKWNPFDARSLTRFPADEYVETKVVGEGIFEAMLAQCAKDDSIEGVRDAAVLHLLHATGLRRSSVASMLRRNIFYHEGKVLAKVLVKGSKEEKVELSPEAVHALETYLQRAPESPYIFPGYSGKPISPDGITAIVARCSKALGDDSHTTPHQFRVSFVTELRKSGAPLDAIQAAVHHSDPKTTQRYFRGDLGAGMTTRLEEYRKQQRSEKESK